MESEVQPQTRCTLQPWSNTREDTSDREYVPLPEKIGSRNSSVTKSTTGELELVAPSPPRDMCGGPTTPAEVSVGVAVVHPL